MLDGIHLAGYISALTMACIRNGAQCRTFLRITMRDVLAERKLKKKANNQPTLDTMFPR